MRWWVRFQHLVSSTWHRSLPVSCEACCLYQCSSLCSSLRYHLLLYHWRRAVGLPGLCCAAVSVTALPVLAVPDLSQPQAAEGGLAPELAQEPASEPMAAWHGQLAQALLLLLLPLRLPCAAQALSQHATHERHCLHHGAWVLLLKWWMLGPLMVKEVIGCHPG